VYRLQHALSIDAEKSDESSLVKTSAGGETPAVFVAEPRIRTETGDGVEFQRAGTDAAHGCRIRREIHGRVIEIGRPSAVESPGLEELFIGSSRGIGRLRRLVIARLGSALDSLNPLSPSGGDRGARGARGDARDDHRDGDPLAAADKNPRGHHHPLPHDK
jgi:hypothetical protein